jgi:hypothetical protein
MHTHINGNIAQLRPAHGMVQVVLAKVVLGQVGDVGELHVRNVRRLEWANIHFWSCGVSCAEGRSLLFLFLAPGVEIGYGGVRVEVECVLGACL